MVPHWPASPSWWLRACFKTSTTTPVCRQPLTMQYPSLWSTLHFKTKLSICYYVTVEMTNMKESPHVKLFLYACEPPLRTQRVQAKEQGWKRPLKNPLKNPDHHSPWHLMLLWFHQVSRVPWSWKKQAPWTLQSPTIFWGSAKFVRFSDKSGPLNVKVRNNMVKIIFLTCKWTKIGHTKSRPFLYHFAPIKKKEKSGKWTILKLCWLPGHRSYLPPRRQQLVPPSHLQVVPGTAIVPGPRSCLPLTDRSMPSDLQNVTFLDGVNFSELG